MTLKLHGMPRSNYYNMAKMCLLEKAMAFDEVLATPSQEAGYLKLSPMGKVPCLETSEGFVSEAYAIADYLEQVQPQPALLPADPHARAKTIELVRHLELDIELVARRCLPAAFFGQAVSDEVKVATQRDLNRGLKSLDRLLVLDPYIAGPEFSLADIYAYFSFALATLIYQKIFEEDLLDGREALKGLLSLIAERESAQQIAADQNA